MKDKTGKTLAGRLSRSLLLWALAILVGLSFPVFSFTSKVTHEFFAESYYNRTLISKEYARRVTSDVYVAVTNNIHYLEQNLDKPDEHKEVMKRIVKNGTRIRSCGISFVKDYYYPQKGHRFFSFAWRNAANTGVIEAADMGDTSLDYLQEKWFRNMVKTDSAIWSEPFYDGYDEKTTLVAYNTPIHDKDGNVVAVLEADISLDWFAKKLAETDSVINANTKFVTRILQEKAQGYIVNHEGIFITHPDAQHILKDNFFNHIKTNEEEELVAKIQNSIDNGQEYVEECLYDEQKCYVFYTPVKYTDWMMITVVPWRSIDTIGRIYGVASLLFIALVMLVVILVCYYSMRNATDPIKKITRTVNHIAKGKFDMPTPELKHDDELRQLCDALDSMQYQLTGYINEQKRAESGAKEK
jgi:HAMP domain-containing protein